jgi:hypothetical protein
VNLSYLIIAANVRGNVPCVCVFILRQVRSPYGGLFERRAVLTWLQRNGSICPLTGQPLVAAELQDAPDVVQEVQDRYKGSLGREKRE